MTSEQATAKQLGDAVEEAEERIHHLRRVLDGLQHTEDPDRQMSFGECRVKVDDVVSLEEIKRALREAEAQLRLLRTALDKITDSEIFKIGDSLPS